MYYFVWQFSCSVEYLFIDKVVEWFDQQNFQAIAWVEDETSGWSDQVDDDHLPIANRFLITGYQDKWSDYELLKEELMQLGMIQKIDISSIFFVETENQDWLKACAHPGLEQQIGPFWVAGANTTRKPPIGSISLIIEAATAFGSGDHPTTQGCLKAIGKLDEVSNRPLKPETILDLGCGSGILAIAACKKWPFAHVIAIDIDPGAVALTQENACINEVSPKLMVLLADGFDHPDLFHASFDLIFANILARPLLDLCPMINKYLNNKGCVILSGLLNDQAPVVIDHYTNHGFSLLHHDRISEWSILIMEKYQEIPKRN